MEQNTKTRKAILLCSHYSKNKGTTDYFRDFLKQERVPNYYLRHPTSSSGLQYSELLYFNGLTDTLLRRYTRIPNPIIDMVHSFIISLYVSLLLKSTVTTVYGFGGFNVLPFLLLRRIFKRKIYFWGVDYSPSRFGNILLDYLYLSFETISCSHADLIISSSKRQESARIRSHKLNKKKSIVINNGVKALATKLQRNILKNQPLGLLYMGALSKHHGVLEFTRAMYIDKKSSIPFHIFGSGEQADNLIRLIESEGLAPLITYHGAVSPEEIEKFIQKSNFRFFGVAPYVTDIMSHIYYGDSLKVKEYLNYSVPFIASDAIAIPSQLKSFGLIYSTASDLEVILKRLETFQYDEKEMKAALSSFSWNALFKKLENAINQQG